MTFGERLRSRREADERSLAWVARKAGISKTYLWELERGRADSPSALVLERLADLFGVTMDELWRGPTACLEADPPQPELAT